MDKQIKKLLEDILKKYKRDEGVLGIMLFGSLARGLFDRYSDIDLYLLLEKKRKYCRLNFLKAGRRIDIIFDTVKEAERYLKEERFKIKRNSSHMLANGKILFQRSNDLRHLMKIAKNNLKLKTKYDKVEILMHKYSIDDFWGEVQRDIEKHDFISFGLNSQLLLNNIMEILLKIKHGYLLQPNMMKEVLMNIDERLARKIEDFYKTDNIKEKKTILGWLVKYTYRKSRGPLPKKWVER